MTAIPFDRIDHVAAGVKDLDLAVAWWCDNFGFVRETDFDILQTGARGAFIRRGDIRIEFFQPSNPLPLPTGGRDMEAGALREGGFHHIAIQVDDVEATLAELQRRGVDVAFPLTMGPFGRYAIVSDPSGNFVEIFPKTDIRDPGTPPRCPPAD